MHKIRTRNGKKITEQNRIESNQKIVYAIIGVIVRHLDVRSPIEIYSLTIAAAAVAAADVVTVAAAPV